MVLMGTKLIAFAAVAAFALAQSTGRLTGVVTDQSSARLANAKVSLYLAGGKSALLAAQTNATGSFDFAALRPALYDVVIEAPGFTRHTQRDVKVDPARETALAPITLDVSSVSQAIEVTTSQVSVQSTTFEVATTITQKQVESLPVPSRQIFALFSTQAGVGSNGFTNTVINGVRPSYSNVTLDGINVQDNWVRTNTLDYNPNRLTIAQVAEMTVSTSNSNASLGGGANQISMVTPSGGNSMHGSLYWFNRNSFFGANDWFNNQFDVKRPYQNLNQAGGSVGGPVKRDKLFYYGAYEVYRRNNQATVTNRILTAEARQGFYSYIDTAGNPQRFNVLTAARLTLDPAVQEQLSAIPTAGNSSITGDGRNTTGYAFNARANVERNLATAKVDYYVASAHTLTGTWVWNSDVTDRVGLGRFYAAVPPVSNDNRAALLSSAWRWTAKPTLTNELRGGFNRTSGPFKVSNPTPAYLLDGLSFTSPVNNRLAEGRDTATYSVQDNATWLKGKHSLSFGYQAQLIRIPLFDYTGTVPTYTVGLSPNSPYGFSAGQIPGLRANELGTANQLLATLAGIITSGNRNFNVTGAGSGFVPGAPQVSNWSQDNHALYLSDSWKIHRRLSLILGVRWDYYTVPNERDSLQLQPVIQNGNVIQTLLGNPNHDLVGNSVGRPFFKRDRNNFAPNVGFAWDVSGTGKTILRGGYSIAYATDNTGNSIINTTNNNSGLVGTSAFANATNAFVRSAPAINPPAFKLPIAQSENFRNTGGNTVMAAVDPNLRTPYVQQWSLGVQREVRGFLVEARYVGNHTVKLLRQLDVNQIDVNRFGFLADFNRARQNGLLAAAAGRGFDPNYNANIPGSQPLTVIPTFGGGGSLNSPANRNTILRGEAGTLAQSYHTTGASGSFFPNPLALFVGLLGNGSHANYNSAQVEVRRQFRNGMHVQANYVFSKAITDANEFRGRDVVLDNNNFRLERSRAAYDITHAFKVNHVVPLPFGKGHRMSNRVLNPVIGGWSLSGFLTMQSGLPVTVLSLRGTLNRGARSTTNTVDTNLTREQLRAGVVGFYMTGNGPYFINPKAIGADGRGTAADGERPFDGQAFFNPRAGTLGSFARRSLNGPSIAGYDFGVIKEVAVTERHRVQLKAEFFNLTNTPSFLAGATQTELDAVQSINNANFGRIIQTSSSPREIQFSLYYRF
jgi:hypothetical protein